MKFIDESKIEVIAPALPALYRRNLDARELEPGRVRIPGVSGLPYPGT